MSDVVESRGDVGAFEISGKLSKNVQAQEQEVKDYTEFLKIEYAKYRQYKILIATAEECVEDDNLDPALKAKIKKILLGEQASQTRLSEKPIENTFETVLGVPLQATELTYSESNKLRSYLGSKLDNKCAKLKSECYTVYNKGLSSCVTEKNESPLELSQDDMLLLDYRNKLAHEQEIYVKNQKTLMELLEELKNIRLQTIPETADQKYKECSFRTHINYLKSQLARHKHRVDIFMESNTSLKAYTEIIKDMKEQQHYLISEIDRLKDLKKKYAEVSCREYNDILSSYLQYKSSLQKKKLLYELYG